jgi:hypothetical protein
MSDLSPDFLSRSPPLVQSLIFLVILLIAAEVGYRAGLAWHRRHSVKDASESWTFEGAMIGLLGLLLAFTYSFAATRFETRRTAILQEADAIGTAYLRAGLAAEPARNEMQDLLRRYAKTRIVTREMARDPARLQAAVAESEGLQKRFWSTATQAIRGRPSTPIDAILFMSLNDVIDAGGRRLAAGRDQLPSLITWMLFAVGAVSLGLAGYSSGFIGRRNLLLTTTLAVTVAAVTYVILDLDHPNFGMIRTSQQSFVDLVRSMEADVTPTREP